MVTIDSTFSKDVNANEDVEAKHEKQVAQENNSGGSLVTHHEEEAVQEN